MDHRFIADEAQLSPPDSRSLQSYALTLPVFEMTDQSKRKQWVLDHGTETRDLLIVGGDGAQSPFAIQRISSYDSIDQRIRLTQEGGGGPDPIYELRRVPGGWKRTGITRKNGAFNEIDRRYPIGGDTHLEAEQVSGGNGGQAR